MRSRLKSAHGRLVLVAATLSLVAAGLAAAPPALAATPPLNDTFPNAAALKGALRLRVAGTNVDATSEPSEPLDGDAFSGSVWYRWTAPNGARVLIEACSTSFDPHLG